MPGQKEFEGIKELSTPVQILYISENISLRASELIERYNLSHGLLIPDALIAATALNYDEAFITKNQRDFRFIEKLKLLQYS